MLGKIQVAVRFQRGEWHQSCKWLFMMNALDDTCQVQSPNPHLDDEVNRNFIQSEIEGGVYLRDLPVAGRLEIQTEEFTPFIKEYCSRVEMIVREAKIPKR